MNGQKRPVIRLDCDYQVAGTFSQTTPAQIKLCIWHSGTFERNSFQIEFEFQVSIHYLTIHPSPELAATASKRNQKCMRNLNLHD